MTAGVFAARYRLKTVILEKAVVGGQPAVAERIENLPGFPELDGWGLSTRLEKHARKLGVEIVESADARAIHPTDGGYRVLAVKRNYMARAVIIASGGHPRRLGVLGEENFARKGVHYCAQCAGFSYEGKRIAVIGGGESALSGALFLAGIGREVLLVHREDDFQGEMILRERVRDRDTIIPVGESAVEEISGGRGVEHIRIRNLRTGKAETLPVDAVFIYAGYAPNTSIVDADKDDKGFLKVDLEMRTSRPGIFACGNVVRENTQIISAMGEGAVAVLSAFRYLQNT